MRRRPTRPPDVPVDLLGIPVALLQKASEEYEALFRELRLMKERSHDVVESHRALPERLSVLISEIGTRFSGLGPGMDERWQGRRQQRDHLRLAPRASASAVAACEFYDAMLDEADEFGVAQLLTLPASPASVAVRRWFLSELIGQLTGRLRSRGATAGTTPSCRP